MPPGSWRSIGLIYLYGLLAAISVGKMPPIVGDISRSFGVTPTIVGVAIGMVFFVSAFLSAFGGWLIDRTGARVALAASSLAIALANALAFFTPNIVGLDMARFIEGIGYIGIITGGAALVMGTTAGSRRISAMVVWSTQVSVGFALGLLIAAPFAGTPLWRLTFAVHGGFAVLLVGASILLPSPRTSHVKGQRPGMFAIYRQIGPWRLGAGYGASAIVGIGAISVVPIYFVAAHHMTISLSSRLLAIANFVNIPGGLLTGLVLATGISPLKVSWLLAAFGAVAGTLAFAPWLPSSFAVVSLILFSAILGGTIALANTLLLRVTRGTENAAATTGLVHQIAGICAFAAPPLFLAAHESGVWTNFAVIIIGGLVLMALFLPTWRDQMLAQEKSLAASPGERPPALPGK